MAKWEHARVDRGVINMDSWDKHLIGCCYRGCERQGIHSISSIYHDHAKHIGCNDLVDIYLCGNCGHGPGHHPPKEIMGTALGRCICEDCPRWDAQLVDRRKAAKHTKYIFCSYRHLMMFTHSHRPEVLDGNLPVGSKGMMI